jgi:hypothetical protein
MVKLKEGANVDAEEKKVVEVKDKVAKEEEKVVKEVVVVADAEVAFQHS